jgi:hypothetical protein
MPVQKRAARKEFGRFAGESPIVTLLAKIE